MSFAARGNARAHRARAFAAGLFSLLVSGLAFDASAAIAVSKSIDNTQQAYPSTIVPGDITAFRITLTNDNAGAAVNNVAFTDNMAAAAITVAGAGVVANTCGGVVTAVVGANSFDLAGGTIPAAPGGGALGSCDIVVEVTSTAGGTAPTNTIPINAVTGDDGALQSNGSAAAQSFTVLTLQPPALAKVFTPDSVVQNDEPSTLLLTITNPNSTANLPLTTITDNLPAGMEVAPVPNASVNCTGTGSSNGTFTPNAGDTTLTVTGGAVGRSGTCLIEVDVIGTTAGATGSQNLLNTLNAADVGNTRGLVPAANASDTLTVNSPLRVAKSFSPNPVRAGQQTNLTITLSNDRPATAITLTNFTDDPIGSPAGLAVTGAVTNTCGGASAATAGNTGIELVGGAIPANGSCTITVPYTGTLPVAGAPQTFSNSIAAGAVGNTDGFISPAASDTVTVNDQLTVSKAVSPTTVAPGNLVTYTVTVRNFTGGTLAGVSFTDNLPGGVAAVATPVPTISAGCGSFTSDFSAATAPLFNFDMPAGTAGSPGLCTITFSAQTPLAATAGTNFDNVLPANTVKTAGTCGAGAVCNTSPSDTARTTIINTAPLAKAFSPNSLSEGGISQLTITLSNNSANTLTGVDLTDNLPTLVGPPATQVVIASPANASTTCAGGPTITATPGASSVRIQNATVPARTGGGLGAPGSCVLRVNVSGPAGSYTNTIPANSLVATETLPDASTRAVTFPADTSAPLTLTPALTATKAFAPATVQAGGVSRLAVRLGNIGTGTLSNVSFTDPLPADMTIATPPNATTTCTGAPVLGATAGAASFTLTGANIPPGGQCEALVDVVAASGADSVNTIPPGNVTAAGGVQNTTAVTATLTKSAGGVVVNKSINPNSITAPGQAATATLTLLNTGGLALTNLALTDFFTTNGLSGGTLNGMRVAATPAATTTCPGGVVSATANATQFTLTGAQLAASGNAGDTCTVSVDVTTTVVGTIQNTIPANAITTAQGVTNTLPTVSSLATLARLGTQKSFTPPTIAPGQRSRLRLRFINPLAVPLTAISVTDNLPAGLVVPPGANPTTTCVGGSITAPTTTSVRVSGGTLPAAPTGGTTSCDAEIDVFAAAAGTFENVLPAGTVTALAGGVPIANEPPDVTATLEVRSAAGIAKTLVPAVVAPGTPSTLTITISNPNTVNLTAASLTDTLPAGLAVALVPNASTTCGGATVAVTAPASATSVSLAGATIPAGGSCLFRVDTVSNTPGNYVNTIPASALNSAEGVSNDEPATDDVTVSSPPTIAKAFNAPSINAGGTSTLTIELGNDNAAALTLTADLVDTLPTAPGNIVVATPNGLGGTCTLGSVTATAGSGLVRYANGATIPAGGCTISVNVTGATNGTHSNFIAANALQTNGGSNQVPATADLVVSPLGFIAGRVFKDNNVTPNGTFETGTDDPLANQTITLSGTDFGADGVAGGGDDVAVSLSVVTDALGNYAFTGLNAGSYTVTEPTQPTGTQNGITTAGPINGPAGGTAGTASAIGAAPSAISNIVLNRDGGGLVSNSPDNDFAEVANSSIAGTVFLDQNNNGVRNGADSVIANVTVELLDAGGDVIATTVTDASGNYSFTNLAPGTYSVREPTQPPQTSNGLTLAGTVPNGGTAGTPTAVAVTPSRISNIVLPPNTASINNNFAEIPNGRIISGRVFLDFDDSGTLNGTDHGITGQTITLTGTDINGNPVTATTTTGADGSYAFTGLPPGTYTVTQPAQPAGTNNGQTIPGSTGGVGTAVGVTPSAISAIDLTGTNTISADNDFAETLGAATDLTIAKSNSPTQFAANSNLGNYALVVSNIGSVASSGVITVVDTLPVGITAVSAPTDSPWTCGVSGDRRTVTCTTSAVAAANGGALPAINLKVAIAAGLEGQSLINIATVAGGGEAAGLDGNNTASNPTQLQPGATISGSVWHNTINRDTTQQPGEPGLEGWIVEAVRGGVVVATATTDANGRYTLTGLPPTTNAGEVYELVFRHPVSRAQYGNPVSNEPGVDLTGRTIANLTLNPGQNIVEQNLPLDPSGVVYDSVTRLPVSGATVTFTGPAGFNPAVHLLGGTGNVTQVTDATGFYQYILLPGAPAGTYGIQVTPPGGYLPTPSGNLPPQPGALTVGPLPNPFLVSPSGAPPPVGSAAVYFFSFVLSGGSADVLNNHIPLDPILSGALVISKTSPLVNVTRGDLVPYTITARNTLSSPLTAIDVRDQIPPGFKYRLGSGSINGAPFEPLVEGRLLNWQNQTFAAGETKTYKLILIVGVGVGEGEYVNQAFGINTLANSQVSNLATATVRVVPDPTFDCSDLIGKVFDDQNLNGYQDQGEPGIPNVRIATVNGLLVTADDQGRFHVSCAAIPQMDRGSNFVMKVDERTLPTGYRLTTENPRDVRLTRGKMSKINFGAALHRVVRIEVTGDAFNDDGKTLKPEWDAQVTALLEQLKQKPSLIRIAHRAENTEQAAALAADIRQRWEAQDCCYPLTVELEVWGALP